jgi:Flp pilus assembly protein TadD
MTLTTMHNLMPQEALFAMAVQALRRGDSAAAVTRLEEAASRDDASAQTCHLLGAQYAQMGRFDEAVNVFERALSLDPTLSIARFQHGLLVLTMGDAPKSAQILSPLLQLGEADPLAHFAAGLVHLMREEFDNALVSLERGMALNASNVPLNSDMRKLMDRIRATIAAAAESRCATDITAGTGTPHVLLSAYTGNSL